MRVINKRFDKDRVKIAFFQDMATPGGAPTSLQTIIKCLNTDRFEPIVVLGHRGPIKEWFADIATTYTYPEPMPIPKTWRIQKYIIRPWFQPRWLKWIIAREQPHILVQNGLGSDLWFQQVTQFDIPKVNLVRGFHSSQFSRSTAFFQMFGQFDHYITNSKAMSIQIQSCAGIDAKKTVTMYPAFDLDTAEQLAEERTTVFDTLDIKPDETVIGGAGSLFFLKGIDLFVRATAILVNMHPNRRFRFFWIGGTPESKINIMPAYAQAVQKLAEDLGLGECFRFIPYQKNIYPLLKALDIFLITSREEAFGRVVVEAMASGVPVVSFPVGGVPEILGDDEYGWLTCGFTPEELATRVGDLLDNPKQQRVLSERGKQRVSDQFDIHKNIRQFEDVIEQVLNN